MCYMGKVHKLTMILLIFISMNSCVNNENRTETNNLDSEEKSYACFYSKHSSAITQTYPFNLADEIEVVSHRSPFESQELKKKEDSVKIGNYIIHGVKERIVLKESQKDSLFSILYNYTNKNGDHIRADCDEPRHAIIFYKKSLPMPIAYIDICFECHQVHFPEQIKFPPFCSEKWKMLENYFRSIGIKFGFIDTLTGRVNDAIASDMVNFHPPVTRE